jgi:hypothetical protein
MIAEVIFTLRLKLLVIRLDYVCDFIFNEVLHIPYAIVADIKTIKQLDYTFINYSNQHFEHGLQIIPHRLLFETGVQQQKIEMDKWNNLPIFFTTGGSFIRFDIFAASFYLLTRFEEYLCIDVDEHGRFPHTSSLAYQHNFLHTPLINQWLHHMLQGLKYFEASMADYKMPASYSLVSYDIDMAYSYKHKGWKRNIGGLLRDLKNASFNAIAQRLKTLLNLQADPFDTFTYLKNIHEDTQVPSVYFMLMAQARSEFDKNLNPNGIAMQSLIQNISQYASIGIHPSYESWRSPELMEQEIKSLGNILDEHILVSRQHYIRLKYPNTLTLLYQEGIRTDFSCGYGSINGFRASTGHPHSFYHLLDDKVYNLRICPFVWMDANSKYEQKMNASEAEKELQNYVALCKNYNTHLVTIWHNFALGSDSDWQGWQQIHKNFLQQLKENN